MGFYIRLMIALNNVGQNNLYCAIEECGNITHAELGPNVNVFGNIHAFVCDECAGQYAPELLEMVQTWRRAEYLRTEGGNDDGSPPHLHRIK